MLNIVSDIVKQGNIANKFKDNKPGDDWWMGFVSKWPEVRLVTPQALPRERAVSLNPTIVQNYFALLHEILSKYDLLNKQKRIYVDETGMLLDHKPPKTAKLAGQDAFVLTSGNKSDITVVACVSASGYVIPLQVVFTGKRGVD